MNPQAGAKTVSNTAGSDPVVGPRSQRSFLSSQPPAIPDHELIRCIGHGSYGEVWLARNRLGTLRAVKIVYRQSFEDSRPFEREFKGIQKFEPISRSHDGLVDILQVGGAEEYFYYVMELGDAEEPPDVTRLTSSPERALPREKSEPPHVGSYVPKTLRSEVRRLGRLPVAQCLQIGQLLASALAHLHAQGLVHRDIKPSNIIFVDGAPKLADIGLVADVSEARSFVGTEGFIPPEGPGAAQADLYSLGKVLYELSTGRDRRDFPALPDDLAEDEAMLELNAVILKTCKSDLRERYQSAVELQGDLVLLQSGRSVKRLQVVERRLALATKLGFALAALMVITVAAYLFQRWQTRQVAQEKKVAERLLYVADMNLAHQAFEAGNMVRAKTLLEEHRPKPGGEDLRGFEWYHVNYLCRDDPAKTFRGHDKPVNAVAVSPDGKVVASGSSDRTIKLWALQTGELVTTLVGHSDSVNCLAISPDGKLLASGSSDRTIKLWSLSTHQVIAALTNHTAAVNALAFSPDGKWLASGSDDHSLRLWDMVNGRGSVAFTNFEDRVRTLSFSGDGRELAVTDDYWVIIYDVVRQHEIARFFDQAGWIRGIAFSPDGATLAQAQMRGVVLWDIAHRKIIKRLKGHSDGVNCVTFSPDGTRLATGSEDTTVRLWDLTSNQTITTFKGHRDMVNSVVFSPDGQTLISGSSDQILKAWDLSALRERDVLRGHTEGVYRIAFSPDDKVLASASRDHTVKLWDVKSGQELATLTGHTHFVTSVAFAPDGKTLYSGSLDRSIRVWDLRTRQEVDLLTGHTKGINCLALSPDGRTLVSGTGWWNDMRTPGELIFWDVPTRKPLTNIAQAGMIYSIEFFPDGKTFVSLDQKGDTLWDVASRQILMSLKDRSWVAVSPDGRSLAVVGPNREIELWDVASRRTASTLPRDTESFALAFSPDGKRLAAYNLTGQVKLWDLETRRDTATLSGPDSAAPSVVFSHDGQTLATASLDYTIRLWRAPRP